MSRPSLCRASDWMRCSRRVVLCAALAASGSAASLGDDVIRGRVSDQTRAQPAANDVVILFRAEHGLQEEARTRTDTRGSFTLPVPHPGNEYLLRVVHDGVNYDQRTSAGDSLSMDVFDTAATVKGIAGSIEIIRAGTVGSLLHVSDMIEIQNRSTPPLTQAGERTFDIYLPARAKLDSVLAAGPGNVAETISAVALTGDSGHYSVSFPLRPGATKFAFNYDLPYEGNVAFRTKHAYPLQEMAIMIPPSMKFSSRSAAFKVLNTGNPKYRALAFSPVGAGPGPEFEISGRGPLPSILRPRNTEADRVPAAPENPAVPKALAPPAASAMTHGLSSGGDSVPARTRPSSRQFWPLGVLGVVVAGACGLAVKRVRAARRATGPTPIREANSMQPILLDELKEEFFQLEASRIRGTISAEQYAATRNALEAAVERAVQQAS